MKYMIIPIVGLALLSIAAAKPQSITIDQTDVHAGDTVTFTSEGGKYVTVACYAGGLIYAETQKAGASFTVPAGDCYAYIDKDDQIGNGGYAMTRFTVQ